MLMHIERHLERCLYCPCRRIDRADPLTYALGPHGNDRERLVMSSYDRPRGSQHGLREADMEER